MYAAEFCNFSYWWIFPIVMMVLCFFMMRSRRWPTMCGFGSRNIENHQTERSDSALEILEKRYASGEINKEEYEQIKKTLTQSTDRKTNRAS